MLKFLRKLLTSIICVFLVSVVCVCSYKITYKILDYKISEHKYDAIADKYVSYEQKNTAKAEKEPYLARETAENSGENTESPRGQKQIDTDSITLEDNFPVTVDFDQLRKDNEDIVGWIYVPDTKINYPVVLGNDNDFYLHRALDKQYSYGGTIFLDAGCRADWTGKNNILYGHNMNDGSMFAGLMKYKSQEYCDKNPFMYLATPDGNFRLDIFSGFVTDPEAEIYSTVFTNEASFVSWYEKMFSKSLIHTDVSLSAKSRVITLSTCTYERDDARFVLLAKIRPVNG